VTPYLLVSGDFVTTGGMDRANYALASYLARRGHTVHLVAHRAEANLAALPEVRVHHVPKPAGSYFLGGALLDHWGRFWARRIACAGGRVVVNAGNCAGQDVSWVHYVHSAYVPTAAGPWHRRMRRDLMHGVFVRNERRYLRRARFVIANSRRTRDDLVAHVGLAPDRIAVVYYGSDPERFRPSTPDERDRLRRRLGLPTDRPLVAFIGALGDRRKGFDIVLSAWCRLCADRRWDAQLVVVGTGAELPAWRERVASDGLADHVRFLGFRRDVPDLLRAVDALVAPTRYEAYGLGVHEALCCGLPAFVSGTAGVAERYPPELADLLLPDPEDIDGVAARLRKWRDDPVAYRPALDRMSLQLRGCTWDDMAATIVKHIESVD
jgi:glycosyltransferase involved in cell wall biosynthesis